MIKIFEGKTPTERNKIIAALVLGVMATLAILYNVVGLPSRKTNVTVKTATPSPTVSPRTDLEVVTMPNQDEMNSVYTTVPVAYRPGSNYAPDAGRNIFAFYEPPLPTPYVTPSPVIKTPTPLPPPSPVPTPPIFISFVTPQSVYAGSKTFRLEVNGDKFTTDSVILFNGNQLPTTFVSAQQLVAEVPSNFISGAGGANVTVATPDGRLSSNAFSFNVQAPPRPQFQYIGMVGRKRANNDTAYFQEPNKPAPFAARLNDVVLGRFRVASISPGEVVFEDVSLGFRHKLAISRAATGQGAGGNPYQNSSNPSNPNNPNQNPNNYSPYNQGAQPYTNAPGGIPGIPNNLPVYVPPQPAPPADDDVDDDGDGNN